MKDLWANLWPKDSVPRTPDRAMFRVKGRASIDVWPNDRSPTFRGWFYEVTETAKRLGLPGELALVYRGDGVAFVELYDLEEKEGRGG